MKIFEKGLRQCGKTFEDFFLFDFNLDPNLAIECRVEEKKELDDEEWMGAWPEEFLKGSGAPNGEGTKCSDGADGSYR